MGEKVRKLIKILRIMGVIVLVVAAIIMLNINKIQYYAGFKKYTDAYNKLDTIETNVDVDIESNTVSENEILLNNGIKISLIGYEYHSEKYFENEPEQKQLHLVFEIEKENSEINTIMYKHMILKDNKSLYPIGFFMKDNLLKFDNKLTESVVKGGTTTREANSEGDISYKERIICDLKDDFISQNLELVLWNIEYQENEDKEYKKVENQKAKFNINIK